MSTKPYAAACERNREPILDVLREYFADPGRVLEIGSGTGQHAVFFAAALPHLTWQTSDVRGNLAGIRAWLNHAALPNTPSPLELDVAGEWPAAGFDGIFSANTLHIMRWREVETMFMRLRSIARPHARLAIYGPFNYGGRYTSTSNADFDAWLKERSAHQGIRDFEAVDELAAEAGFALLADRAMPANNRCLVWQRRPCGDHGAGGRARLSG